MMNRFAFHELKKDFKNNIPVIIQTSCALLLIIASISSVTSRFHYYNPFRNLIEKSGYVALIESLGQYNSDDLCNSLNSCESVYMTYSMSAGTDITSPIVYDDYLMSRYRPNMETGRWVISSSDKQYPQVMVSNNSGFKVGDIITTNKDLNFEVAGTFSESEKLLLFNNMAANLSDYRLLYSELISEKYTIVISRSEADKIKAEYYPYGIAFITYDENITSSDESDNLLTLSNHGMIGSFNNSKIAENSIEYIYSQLYTLLPILVCILILLLISIISVNSISTIRRLKYYAIYRVCGLSWKRCSMIFVIKSTYLSLISVIVCFLLYKVKQSTSLFNSFIIEFGLIQIICCIVFLMINILVSLMVCSILISRKRINQILRTN